MLRSFVLKLPLIKVDPILEVNPITLSHHLIRTSWISHFIRLLRFLEFHYTVWITFASHTRTDLIIGMMLAIISYVWEAYFCFLCFTRQTIISFAPRDGSLLCFANWIFIFYALLGGPSISYDSQGESLCGLARSFGFLLPLRSWIPTWRALTPRGLDFLLEAVLFLAPDLVA